jgi:tyrocidine synthetase-3
MKNARISSNIAISSGKLQADSLYWDERLSQAEGEIPSVSFPCPPSVRPAGTPALDMIERRLPPALVEALNRIANGSTYALHIILAAVLQHLLYRLSGYNDVAIGTPVFAKNTERLLNKKLLLRRTVRDDETFEAAVRQSREIVDGARRHQNYPFNIILARLGRSDDAAFPSVALALDGLQDTGACAGVPVSFVFTKGDGSLDLRLTFDPRTSSRSVVATACDAFVRLLAFGTAAPRRPFSEFDLISAGDFARYYGQDLARFPQTRTIVDIFEACAERFPTRTAVVSGDTRVTYAALRADARRIAARLQKHGAGVGDIVAVHMERSHELIAAILGTLLAGAAYLPLDPSSPASRLEDILRDSRAKYLIAGRGIASPDFVGAVLRVDQGEVGTAPRPIDLSPHDLAYIIYTSGTTGQPKGAMIEHRNVVQLFFAERMPFTFTEHDVWTMFHSQAFDFSVWEIFGALLYGGTLVIVPHTAVLDPGGYLDLVVRERVTVVNQTPTAFYNLAREALRGPRPNLYVRHVIFGGEKLEPRLLLDFHRAFPGVRLINMFGITETTVHVTYRELREEDMRAERSPIGVPLPSLRAYVMDAKRRPLPPEVPGELYVGGAGVCRGYLRRPELTAERFVEDPCRPGERLYRSGDRAYLLENGEMEYIGRSDTQIKVRGYRIEPGEVEAAISGIAGVSKALVVGVKDGDATSLCAYFESGSELPIEQVRAELARAVPAYMIPSFFVQVDAFPTTPNGKVDVRALPSPFAHALRPSATKAPVGEHEQVIRTVFARALGLPEEDIGAEADFFSLGGDSIRALRAVVLANDEFGVDLQISDLYAHASVHKLAAFIASGGGHAGRIKAWRANGASAVREFALSLESDPESAARLPDGRETIYPLTNIESAMIYCSLLRPEEPVYYDQFPWRVRVGDVEILRTALETMVRRHAILRSRYYVNGLRREARVVMREVAMPLEIVDLTGLSPEEQNVSIQRIRADELAQRYAFDGDLLWKMHVFSLATEGDTRDCVIVWSFHHAMLDGWSMASFVTEISCLLANDGEPLPELRSSYGDYCALALGRSQAKRSRAFWKRYMEGYVRSRLPFNYTGQRISTDGGMRSIARRLDGKLLAGLHRFASNAGVSLKAACLAAYVWVLHALSTDKEVVTGVVSHDRPEIPDADKILGCFLTTVPIRIVPGDYASAALLAQACHEYLAMVRPHEMSLAEIATAIGEVASSGNPLFDTLLNFHDFHVANDWQRNETLEWVADGRKHLESMEMTNTLLDFEVSRTLGLLTIKIKYAPAYFHQSEVEYALDIYARALALFASDSSIAPTADPLITDAERAWLTHEWNGEAVGFPSNRTLHGLFEAQAATAPERTALIRGDRQLTYRELDGAANRLARVLVAHGVKPGEPVGLMAGRSFEMFRGMLAILKAGGSYVPVDPEYPDERRLYLLENSGARLLVTDADCPTVAAPHSCTIVRTRDGGAEPETELRITVDPAQLAYTMYTSGSTGRPKGVMVDHRAAVNLIDCINRKFEVTADDRLLFVTSMCFDLSVYDIFGILAAGGSVVIADRDEVQNASTISAILAGHRVTFWDSAPSTLNFLLDVLAESKIPYRQESLRRVFLSGDWLSVRHVRQVRRFFPNARVVALGGATEATIWSNYYLTDDLDPIRTTVPYGRPLQNNFFYILDDDQRPTPRGVAGELYIGGVGVARGYANDPDATSWAFLPDPFRPGGRMYRTGDIGRLLPDGNMEFLGRRDFQVKIRGFRVEPGEIESLLLGIDGVNEAVVLPFDGAGGKYLCAYLSGPREVRAREVRTYLAKRAPAYMIPDHVVNIPRMPLTPNGKIDRRALPLPTRGAGSATTREEPRNETERWLQGVISGLIEGGAPSVTDDLFALGMHSLQMANLASRISQERHVQIPLREIFSDPTIRAIAARLEGGRPLRAHEGIVSIADASHYSISHAQRRLWVIHQLDQGRTSAYNITVAFRIRGRGVLDTARMKRALELVVRRHESLRTTFVTIDHEPYQRVHAPGELDPHWSELDLRGVPSVDGRLEEAVREEATAPFDLSAGPLLRARCVRIDDEMHVLVFCIHHIVSDGWSTAILMREVAQAYTALESDPNATLPALQLQYRDYAAWQSRLFASSAVEGERAYWLDRLGGKLPVLELPSDYPRPAVRHAEGGCVRLRLDRELHEALRTTAGKDGASPFMAFVALVYLLLHRYSMQTDIILGSPVAGRDHQLEDQVGFYVNMLALRAQIDPEQGFRALLRVVREITIQALDHAQYPFDRLVDELRISRDFSRNPVFDVVVAMQEVLRPASPPARMGSIEVVETPSVASKFDLTFLFYYHDEGTLGFNVEYNGGLFSAATAKRLATHFVRLAASAVRDPDAPVGMLEMTSDDAPMLACNAQGAAMKDGGRIDSSAEAKLLFEAPATDLERRIASLWAKVLHLDPRAISVNVSFFDVGGNSLRLIRLHAELREWTREPLPIVDLFQNDTVRAMAAAIAKKGPEGAAPGMTGIEL